MRALSVVVAGVVGVACVACGSDSSDGASGGSAAAAASGGGGGSGGGSGGGGTGAKGGSGGSAGGGSGGMAGTAGSGGSGGSGGSAGSGSGGAAGSGGSAGAGAPAPMVGVYVGNDPAEVTKFEAWLGRDVDGVLGYTGAASWADFDGSVGWAAGLWAPLDRRVFWSVPLIPAGASLASAAAGDYDDHYKQAAQKLAGFRPGDPKLFVRTGWELNGDWFPWAAQGKEQDFIGAFQHFVTAFRSVSNRFVFEWNVNMGNNTSTQMNPETAYPGDQYVDFIGMDFYWNTQWDPKDPDQAWTSMRDRPYGLAWHQTFAAAHGKPTTYSEWGIMSDDAGPYIANAKKWFDDHAVVFHTYWDSNSAFQGKLSGGQYPKAAAAYISAFGP